MSDYLPALVDQPSAFTFSVGDRVMRTYPLVLLARVGTPDKPMGTVVSVGPWIGVQWDNDKRSFMNPAYLKKVV